MQYDPKLRIAMNDIKKILEQYGIAGIIILHSDMQCAEFLHHISPPYSAARWMGDMGIHVRAKLADFGGDKATRNKVINDTVNMALTFRDLSAQAFSLFDALVNTLKTQIDIDDTPGEITSHTQQNN